MHFSPIRNCYTHSEISDVQMLMDLIGAKLVFSASSAFIKPQCASHLLLNYTNKHNT